MRTVRWMLVVPAALAGWYLALLLGIVLFESVDRFCPDRYVVSEHCVSDTAGILRDLIEVAATSLSAVFVVSFAAGTAPHHKPAVAWAAFVVGAAAATLLARHGEFGPPYFGAIVAGFVTALVFHRYRGQFSA